MSDHFQRPFQYTWTTITLQIDMEDFMALENNVSAKLIEVSCPAGVFALERKMEVPCGQTTIQIRGAGRHH